ncbi:hypothetical protein [Halomonas sp. E14]|uniref:hypothetical protein n=1 Tax=Halomonas sp. E14 TaxID=3397245 RepID=UPI00403ECEAD
MLTPTEQLNLAEAHERAELTRYRRLAFSFLPYDTAVSHLMASLGIQCEACLEEQRRLVRQLGLPPTDFRDHGAPATASPLLFMANPTMALEAIMQSVIDADYSVRFYRHLRDTSSVAAFYPALTAILKQKRREHALLEEFLASRIELEPMAQRA